MENLSPTLQKIQQIINHLTTNNHDLTWWWFNGFAPAEEAKKHDEHESDFPGFETNYIDQYQNGGYTGDEYAGYIYLELEPDVFAKIHYAM